MTTLREILAQVARGDLSPGEGAARLRASDAGNARPGAASEGRDDLRGMLAAALKIAPGQIDFDRPLSDYGLTSITVTALLQSVNEAFATRLAPTIIFEFATLRAFAKHLESLGRIDRTAAPAIATAPSGAAGRAATGTTPAQRDDQRKPAASLQPVESRPGEIETELAALWAEAEKALAPREGEPKNGADLSGNPAVPPTPPSPQQRVESSARAAANATGSFPAPNGDGTSVGQTSVRKIAVIGMAGVLPQCDDLAEFWAALVAGRDLITEVSPERWDWKKFADAPAPGARFGGFIRDPAGFDAAFFGISPLEAKLMDPQQRLLLQTVWHTLEDAGYRPAELAGSNTAVFIGVSTSDYFEAMREAGVEIDAHTSTGFAHCLLANRVSFLFDWHGPSQIIDTACSSSLIALHRAAQAIAAGDCTTALVGGVNLLLTPTMFLSFAKAGMLSPDGRCQAFDRRANGYVRGEGVGAVLLKPLAQAEADGDHIHAVLLATAENHGGRATSLTAPNPAVQAALLVQAYRAAGVDPRSVGYIETHGTGTALGDPIEIAGLQRAFTQLETARPAPPNRARPRCWLGSVKTNIGHLESAAGIAGVLKLVLALRHGQIPPNLHFHELNPHVDFADGRFGVPTVVQDWPAAAPLTEHGSAARRGGVSSFGFGGAYAHAVFEAYQPLTRECGDEAVVNAREYVLISAPTTDQLDHLLERWAEQCRRWLAAPDAPPLAGIAVSSRCGRVSHRCRIALRASSVPELHERLGVARRGVPDANVLRGPVPAEDDGGSGFVREHDAAPDTGDLDALVQRWCAGETIAWSRGGHRRVPLPLYPFRKIQHWFRAADPRRANDSTGSRDAAAVSGSQGEKPRKPEPDILAFEARYQAEPLTPGFASNLIAVLGTSDVVAMFRPAAAALAAQGVRVRFVTCADAFRDANGAGMTIDARSADPIESALRQLQSDGCAHALVLSESLLPALSVQPPRRVIFKERVQEAVRLGFRIVQAASRVTSTARALRFAYACHASLSVDSAREEAIAALCQSAYQEPSGLIGHTVRFAGAMLDPVTVLGAAIRDAMLPADEPQEITYRSGERTVRRIVERPNDDGPGLTLHRGATYVAAGGLGEVGARFAEWLAREWSATVVILGRRKTAADTEARLAGLAPGAGRIVYQACDITDADALQAAVADVVSAHGAVRGVFHLARRVEAGLLDAKDERGFDRVTSAKVDGAVLLDAATATQPLDFFVLFSSIAGDWGLAGAADYAYACRFQNSFAAVRQSWVDAGLRSGASLAIGWPQWRYDAHSHAERDSFLESRGFALLDVDRGFSWLARCADCRRNHTAFVVGDASRLRALLAASARRVALSTKKGDPSWDAWPDKALALPAGAGAAGNRDSAAPVAETPPGAAGGCEPMRRPAFDDEQAVRELLAELSEADLDQLYAAEFGADGHGPQPAGAADPAAAPGGEELRATIRQLLGAVLQHAPESIGGAVPFERLGMDSILGVRVVQRLEKTLGITVPPRWLIENSTVDTLAQKIRTAWPPGHGAVRR